MINDEGRFLDDLLNGVLGLELKGWLYVNSKLPVEL